MSDLLEKSDTDLRTTDAGDHDKLSHYVSKDAIMMAAIEGVPATAVCGKTWFPNSLPEKYQVCPECKEIYEAMN